MTSLNESPSLRRATTLEIERPPPIEHLTFTTEIDGAESVFCTYIKDPLDWVQRRRFSWKTNLGLKSEDIVITFREQVSLTYLNWSTTQTWMIRIRDDFLLSLSVTPSSADVVVEIWAKDLAADLEEVVAPLKEAFPPREEAEDNTVFLHFWHNSSNGPRESGRALIVPKWEDVAANYPESVSGPVSELIKLDLLSAPPRGKLIVWTGEPGTGKTYAIRALIDAWRHQADPHYIIDPEAFLNDGNYLTSLVLGQRYDEDENKYRLFILEDAGELLVKDARAQSGNAMGRLLNLSEGLIGQGVRALFLITTNEEVGTLHGAITRPGRALQNLAFKPFTDEEAATWLTSHGHTPQKSKANPLSVGGGKSTTLADLYHQINTAPVAVED